MSQIKDAQDLFKHGLGEALYVERKVLTMLKDAAENVSDEEVKQGLQRHHSETEGQIQNLERGFEMLGFDVKGSKCPAIDGIRTEQQEMISGAEGSILDAALLDGASKTEHYEISLYTTLLTMAEQMGQEELVALLQENLEQEQHMLQQVESAAQKIAPQLATA